MEADERQILDSCLAGDEDAQERLYSRQAGRVMAYLLRSGFARADADDLLQETFLRAFRSLATFNPARGTLDGWIGAIARNAARRQWEKRRETNRFDAELAEEILPAREDASADPGSAEELDLLRSAIRALPGELRRVLELRYVEGLTGRCVAETLGMPEATVRLRLREAYGLLEKRLAEAGVSR